MMQATGSPLTAGISSTAIVVLSRIMTVFSFALVMLRTLYAKWLYRKAQPSASAASVLSSRTLPSAVRSCLRRAA